MTAAIAWHSARAEEFESKYELRPAFQERVAVWSEFIRSHCSPQAQVLDAGCGPGILSFVAARHAGHVKAIDGSDRMIAIGREKAARTGVRNVDFHVSRIEDLAPADHGRFDLVLCSSVLEYVDDHWAALARLRACTKPGGTLLFSLPNSQSLYRWCERACFAVCSRPEYLAHVRHFASRGRLVPELEKRSFNLLATRYYAATPLLSRFARRLGAAALSDNLLLVAVRA